MSNGISRAVQRAREKLFHGRTWQRALIVYMPFTGIHVCRIPFVKVMKVKTISADILRDISRCQYEARGR